MNRREFMHLLRMNRARLPRRAARVAQQAPKMIEARYLRRMREGMLADMWRLVDEQLLPALPALEAQARAHAPRADAAGTSTGGPDAGGIFDRMVEGFFKRWTRKRYSKIVQPFGTRLAQFNAAQLNKTLEQLVGIDVVGSEPWLKGKIEAFTQQNVALIKTVPSIFFDEIEKIVTERIATGERWEGLTDELRERYDISERRAKLIARDQSTKFCGALNKQRQTALGIGGYHWRTMGDNRVRDEHEALAGKRFEWDKPPSEGDPGHAVQCRCYADPDLQPLIDEARRETGFVSGSVISEAQAPAGARPPSLNTPRGAARALRALSRDPSRVFRRTGWSYERELDVPLEELDDVPAVVRKPVSAAEIARGLRNGDTLPAIKLGEFKGLRGLTDGNNRLATIRMLAAELGIKTVRVRFASSKAAQIRKRAPGFLSFDDGTGDPA